MCNGWRGAITGSGIREAPLSLAATCYHYLESERDSHSFGCARARGPILEFFRGGGRTGPAFFMDLGNARVLIEREREQSAHVCVCVCVARCANWDLAMWFRRVFWKFYRWFLVQGLDLDDYIIRYDGMALICIFFFRRCASVDEKFGIWILRSAMLTPWLIFYSLIRPC